MSQQPDENKRKKLSVDELRNYKGFENYTDEQAEEVISYLEKLSNLFYHLYLKYNDESITNQETHNEKQVSKKRDAA